MSYLPQIKTNWQTSFPIFENEYTISTTTQIDLNNIEPHPNIYTILSTLYSLAL
jgi:hypothetical protein